MIPHKTPDTKQTQINTPPETNFTVDFLQKNAVRKRRKKWVW